MNHEPYIRPVHYYETDKMAVVHHSNYIRYFEEARVDFLHKNGIDFNELERNLGIMFPVLDAQCTYIKSAQFDDTLSIYVSIRNFTGVRFVLDYRVELADGSLCATGSTTLGLLNQHYVPVSIKRKAPEIYQRFVALVAECQNAE